MDHTIDIDAIGLLCPLPVLRLRKRLNGLAPGTIVRLRASDRASWVDVPHFCAEAGHDLIDAQEQAGVLVYLVRRGPDGPSK